MNPPVDAPDVQRHQPAHVDAERVERVRQLEPPARHVRHRRRAQPQLGAGVDQIARLFDRPVARQHLARQDQRPRLLARGRQPLLDQRQIRPDAPAPDAAPAAPLIQGATGRSYQPSVANSIALRRMSPRSTPRSTAMGL